MISKRPLQTQRNRCPVKAFDFNELLRGKALNHYDAKVRKGLKSSRLTLAIIVLAVSAFSPTSAQQTSAGPVDSFNPKAYRIGEQLTYDVSFSQFISAAHIELQVAKRGTFFGRDAIRLRAHAETTGVVNVALLALNNDYISYVDPGSGLPIRTQEVVRQSGRASNVTSDYMVTTPAATASGTGELAGIYDILSAIYRVRAMPLTAGASYLINVRHENQDYQAEIRVLGHEMIKTKIGSFNAIVVRLNAKNSGLEDNRTRIYFSDDDLHIPVLVRIKHPAGEIRAELAGSDLRTAPAPRPSPSPVSPQPTVTIKATTPEAGPTRSDLPFKVGERLNYLIYLPRVDQPVGTALYEVKARGRYFDHEGFLLSARLQTTPAIGRLFTANDQVNSYVDPVSLLPFRTEMVLVEGNRRTNRNYTVDQDRGSAVENGTRIEIPVGTHDLVSLLYAVRTFELSPAKRNAISILVDKRPVTLFITSQRRETIDLGGQKLPAVLLTLTTDDSLSDKYQFRAWVSDDFRRLPLRFTAATELGLVRADLAITPVTPQ